MSIVKRLAAEMAMALDHAGLYDGSRAIDYIDEYEEAAEAILNGPVALELRRETLADGWEEGALWAAVECDAIPNEHVPWLAPGENPYNPHREQ